LSSVSPLDSYTAYVAADLDILPNLRNWFGELFVPASTIALFDHLVDDETNKLAQTSMSIGWHNGQFVRHTPTDDEIQRTMAALQSTRDRIIASTTVVPVLLPDDLPQAAANLAAKLGATPFEPIYLARARGTVLLSDDIGLRSVGGELANTTGLWLQPALVAARDAGQMTQASYTTATARMAAHRHSVSISPQDLLLAFHDGTDPNLVTFTNLASRLGGETADMLSHAGVAIGWLLSAWRDEQVDDRRREHATSILLRSLLRNRQQDWASAIGYTAAAVHHIQPLLEYIDGWITGHFLSKAQIMPAFRYHKAAFLARVRLAGLPEQLKSSASRSSSSRVPKEG
jgi:hypothetical protein